MISKNNTTIDKKHKNTLYRQCLYRDFFSLK
nr:MAG TPA: hypothetical protein [Caudoviricetes sp.]